MEQKMKSFLKPIQDGFQIIKTSTEKLKSKFISTLIYSFRKENLFDFESEYKLINMQDIYRSMSTHFKP